MGKSKNAKHENLGEVAGMMRKWCAVVSVSVSSLALYLGSLAAARALHAAMLGSVLRAPTIGFFDCTPVGRVLNRFSKDVDVLDNVLPMTLRGWTSCFFAVCRRPRL